MTLDDIFKRVEETAGFAGCRVDSVHSTNHFGDNVLHTACIWGDLDAIKILMDAGSDINAKGETGCTPLHYAASNNHPEVIKFLINAGAENKSNDDGIFPFELARLLDNKEAIEAFNDSGLYYDINSLIDIMRQLRDPETGCPWDLEQNFKTIAPYTIEEAYEVADAIERNDLNELKDELGDLLLQVIFHSQMAKEEGAFEFNDVVTSICDKMIRRHPHVFSDTKINDPDEQTALWDKIKAEERAAKSEGKESVSILDDVPNNLPGLLRARKLTRRAANVGFDWPDANSVLDKLDEESDELKEAIESKDQDHIEEEFGDLLFVLANLSRHLKIDPEKALRRANQKFVSRFHSIERETAAQGKTLESSSLDELDALWNAAKLTEKMLNKSK